MTAGGSSVSGATQPLKIVANIFISFIGAGVLGLPFAFKEAGMAEGILIMSLVGFVSIKAMFLIIDCKYFLLQKRSPRRSSVNNYMKSSVHVNGGSVELKLPLLDQTSLDASDDQDDKIHIDTTYEMTYGDLGFYALGEKGRLLVDGTVVVSQIGFCCAYLIFISENLSTYISGVSTSGWLLIFLPPLYLLCLLRKLDRLAIFSVFAQASTILAFAVVFWFDFEHYHVMRRFHPREFSVRGFPFFFAISIYCYEGAGMILSLENSLAEHVRPKFKLYFRRTMIGVTALYIVFGCSGYLSFGPFTKDIITLNLPRSDSSLDFAMMVKCCLCFSLFFTYPLMMFPVVTIIEKRLPTGSASVTRGNLVRLTLVVTSGLVVILIPNFANLMAIIGGTCCTLLAFVLPGLFHLRLLRKTITRRQKYFDVFLMVLGAMGAVIATWDAVTRMTGEPEAPDPSLRALTVPPVEQIQRSLMKSVVWSPANGTESVAKLATSPVSIANATLVPLAANSSPVFPLASATPAPLAVNSSLVSLVANATPAPLAVNSSLLSRVANATLAPLLASANLTRDVTAS